MKVKGKGEFVVNGQTLWTVERAAIEADKSGAWIMRKARAGVLTRYPVLGRTLFDAKQVKAAVDD